jgi:D-sedoheptulose 7-phosphate isomerase
VKRYIHEYFQNLKDIFDIVVTTGMDAKSYQLDEAIDITIDLIIKQAALGKKLLFIGNGASASISSHMAADFWKNANIKATAFNDAALLTCVANDFGYNHVFEKPLEMFANKGDILFAISSSGKSENIIKGVLMAKSKKCHIITLSGFDTDNPLRSLGDINFYVPHSAYGPVEVIHHSICHCMLDTIIRLKAEERSRKS